MELWNLSTTNTTFLRDVSLLDDATQYPSCVHGSVGSVVLKDIRLNTSTVAYYTGVTPGSRACFVCDENSGYELNTTTNERICQSDATWSEGPITCGMCVIYAIPIDILSKYCMHALYCIYFHLTSSKLVCIATFGYLFSTYVNNVLNECPCGHLPNLHFSNILFFPASSKNLHTTKKSNGMAYYSDRDWCRCTGSFLSNHHHRDCGFLP